MKFLQIDYILYHLIQFIRGHNLNINKKFLPIFLFSFYLGSSILIAYVFKLSV